MNEVEITDIPIARISEQYLATLEAIRELDLDVAGEFLLMAATLAWIKSRMLLPPDGLEPDGEGPDPRAELVARLLEYQRFKQVAGELAERRWLGRDVFEAHVAPLEPRPESEREVEAGLFQLIEAYRRVLARAGPSATPHEVEVETRDRARAHARRDASARAAALARVHRVPARERGRPPSRPSSSSRPSSRSSSSRAWRRCASTRGSTSEAGREGRSTCAAPTSRAGGAWNEQVAEVM